VWPLTRLSGISRRAARLASNAIGVLTSRHHRQEAYWVSTPPRTNPMARPPPAMAPHTPNARARSRASVKVTVTNDRAAGAISAANAPCMARAAKSRLASGASPPIADAPANPSRPTIRMRLRPI
jgi:hypothetical protein